MHYFQYIFQSYTHVRTQNYNVKRTSPGQSVRASTLEHASEQSSALSSAATASVPQQTSPPLAWDLSRVLSSRKEAGSTLFQAFICAQTSCLKTIQNHFPPGNISSTVSRLNSYQCQYAFRRLPFPQVNVILTLRIVSPKFSPFVSIFINSVLHHSSTQYKTTMSCQN